MRRIIVNSTPLVVLCNTGQLGVLRKLYGEISIPEATLNEITEKEDSVCQLVKAPLDWIHVEKITDKTEKKIYRAKLHDGEVEIMILTQENPKADLVIIDDNAAKKTAKYLGPSVAGTLGVLLKVKKHGTIAKLGPALGGIKRSNFYIGEGLEKLILEQAGE